MKIPRKLFTEITNGRKLKWYEKATFEYTEGNHIIIKQDGNIIAKALAVIIYVPVLFWQGFGAAGYLTKETKSFLKGDFARVDEVREGTDTHQRLHDYCRGKEL